MIEVEMHKLSIALSAEKLRIALLLVFVLAGAGSYYLFTPKQYEAESLVVSAVGDQSTGAVASLAGQISSFGLDLGTLGNSGMVTTEAIALLSSRTVLEPFLIENGVMDRLFPEGYVHERSVEDPSIPTVADGFEEFSEGLLEVREDNRTGIISVSVHWTDPVESAQWSIALVDEVNRYMRARAKDEAVRSLEFLTSELERANTLAVQQVITGLMESELRKAMIANVRPDYAFRFVEKALAPDPRHFTTPSIAIATLSGAFVFLFGLSLLLWARLVKIERDANFPDDGV